MSYKPHRNCRACGYGPFSFAPGTKGSSGDQRLQSVLNLGVLPLPNAFRQGDDPRPGHYPVDLLVCPRCHLGQLSAVVDPEVMYLHYPYVTSPSKTMQDHLRLLWDTLNRMQPIDSVVEIGSNDGLALESFQRWGARSVLGIDPASNLADIANERGVRTVCSLFNRRAAEEARASLPPINLVLARHVFCHIDDWKEFINNAAVLCDRDTIICLEVPYAHDTIANGEWDTVYAEHLSYLTVRSVVALLEESPLMLQHIVRFPIHGGAIALILRRIDGVGVFPEHPSVNDFLRNERCSLEDWRQFGVRARDQIGALKILIGQLRGTGKRVVGYGASAKSTMWINAMGLGARDIEAVYDGTPQKVYTCIPGTDIPVRHEGSFFADAADYAVLWAWNFMPEILAKQENWAKRGGRWIVPVPEVKVL